jgi:hypothetical protein
MDKARGQVQSQALPLQGAYPHRSPRHALSSRRATGTMTGEELVNRFVVAGRDIFAQTDLAAEVQVDILAGIAWIVGKKLGDYEARGRTALAAKELAAMKLKKRREFLERHYQDRTPWAQARPRKPQEPTPADFQRWADWNFPDRRHLELVLSDLIALDKEAYGKLRRWASPARSAAKIDPAEFGFPSKMVRYDPAKPVPTGAQVFEAFKRGDPRAVELRRDYMRARYHLHRDIGSGRRTAGSSDF